MCKQPAYSPDWAPNDVADFQFFIEILGASVKLFGWGSRTSRFNLSPTALRSPELIFGGKIDSSIDIWSFGCLIFEMQTGVPLFSVMVLYEDDRESTDDEHLLQMNDILEPLPDIYGFRKSGRELKTISALDEKGWAHVLTTKMNPYIDDPLEVRFEKYKRNDIGRVEAGVITSLIRSILKYEPSQRPTAEELLKHPWFQE